jgi:PAS domain S-box-containing protein
MPDAIYFKDRKGRFLAASDYTARVFGVESAEHLIGKSDFDFFTEDQARVFYQDEQQIIASGEAMVSKDEHEFMRDGRERWFGSTKVPLRGADGEIIGILGISRDETERMKAEIRLQERDRELREHLGRIEAEVERARLVQQMLLPAALPQLDRCEIAVRSEPLEVVSGDYWAFPDLADGATGVFLGDLTGHGVSAALYMTLVRFVCDRYWSGCGVAPHGLLTAINADLQNQMPGAFLTAVYVVMRECDNGLALRLAAAAHTTPLLIKPDGTTRFIELKSSAALALFEDFSCVEEDVLLAPGETLVLYTDGVTEVWNDADQQFGEERLAQAAAELAGSGGQAMVDGLLAAADAWRGDCPLQDDAVVIAITAR